MTILDEIEKWTRLIGPMPKQIPSLVKMTPSVYNTVRNNYLTKPVSTIYQPIPPVSRFEMKIVLDEDLEVPWIVYDQHGEEMGRAK